MAKSALSLLMVAAAIFTLAQLVSGEDQQQNPAAIATDVEVQPKSEEVQIRVLREADAKKKKKGVAQKPKKNRPRKQKGKKKSRKSRKNIKSNCVKGKKCRKGGKQRKRTKVKKRKNSNPMQRAHHCPHDLLQQAKNYRKFRNNLNQVKRIINNCGVMENKAEKAKTGTFQPAGEATCTKDTHANISKELLNCNVTATAICTPPDLLCLTENITHYTTCRDTLQTYQDAYAVCLNKKDTTSIEFCDCVHDIPNTPSDKCLDFATTDKTLKSAKRSCTGSSKAGSFGWCRKKQIEAADDANCAPCFGGVCCDPIFSFCCPLVATTAGSNVTTSGSSGKKRILRKNLVKKWIKH